MRALIFSPRLLLARISSGVCHVGSRWVLTNLCSHLPDLGRIIQIVQQLGHRFLPIPAKSDSGRIAASGSSTNLRRARRGWGRVSAGVSSTERPGVEDVDVHGAGGVARVARGTAERRLDLAQARSGIPAAERASSGARSSSTVLRNAPTRAGSPPGPFRREGRSGIPHRGNSRQREDAGARLPQSAEPVAQV